MEVPEDTLKNNLQFVAGSPSFRLRTEFEKA
jgi:hypothetical protein